MMHTPFGLRELPDRGIVRPAQTDIEHRHGIMSGLPQPAGVGRRQVFVEQQLHALASTVSSAASCEA
jgi:hypothetical protein